jgi:O-methyltransferase
VILFRGPGIGKETRRYRARMSAPAWNPLREVREIASLAHRRVASSDPRDRDDAGYKLTVRFARWALPGYVATKGGKSWFADAEFFRAYDRLVPGDSRRSAERKYFLRSLLSLADGLPGDTAECGVWNGASSWFICRHFAGVGKTHHAFDSFEGLPEPAPVDGGYWRRGDCFATEADARANLAEFPAKLYRGWIPDRFPEIEDRRFCFVNVDVDLYEPTRDSIEFFYPRMVAGGVMLFDDHGSAMQSPGAARAIDEFMATRPEPLITAPTAQAFLVKR